MVIGIIITKNLLKQIYLLFSKQQNDKYVNGTVNDARSKLAALYQKGVIGPASYKRKLSPHAPLRAGTTSPVQKQKSRLNIPIRSQSSLALNQLNKEGTTLKRNIKSAQPKLRQLQGKINK